MRDEGKRVPSTQLSAVELLLLTTEYSPAIIPTRNSAARRTQELWKFLGCRLTSPIPVFRMIIVGSLPWGCGGHHKSKNPVNIHALRKAGET
jgi:hypothetical protein